MKKYSEKRFTRYKTRGRIRTVSIGFLLFLSLLVYNLFTLGIVKAEIYREKVNEQITTSTKISARRGIIYDSEGVILASDRTVYRVFTSTKRLKAFMASTGRDAVGVICEAMAPLLSLDKDKLYKRLTSSPSLDITLKRAISEDEYKALLSAVDRLSLQGALAVEATSSRYYPEGTLLAHVLGFVGSDSQGLYGLEYYYDKTLTGEAGYYLYGKDANGNELPSGFTDIVEPKDGNSLVLTVDTRIQSALEGILEKIRIEQMTSSRTAGICMDIKTGKILAMATSSPFNPNSPYELDAVSQGALDASGLTAGTDEYLKKKRELLELSWSNKAISETYEPGSTFKIVTVASALDSGAVSVSDKFSCVGYLAVGGWHIRCHKAKGHGSGFDLAYGLQMSCNPCMMTVASRMGADSFYEYVKRFGYLEKCGIDLPSEAGSIFHDADKIGTTELATASFGQRFKVSLLRQLTSVCAVANGGRLMKPYIVDSIVSPEGNIISKTSPTVIRQVVDESVARTVTDILEAGTSGDGGAKNAAVAGYKIAAKTGTSQKFDVLDENGNSYLRIGSCVGYSVNEDGGGIAVIIMTDEPQGYVKYGSVTAAPYVSELLSFALPYLGYESACQSLETEIPDMRGMSRSDAETLLKSMKLTYEIIGDGEYITRHTPSGYEKINESTARVILYTDESEAFVTVPELLGMEYEGAVKALCEKRLNIGASGAVNPEGCTVISQSVPAGCVVPLGSIIDIEISYLEFED